MRDIFYIRAVFQQTHRSWILWIRLRSRLSSWDGKVCVLFRLLRWKVSTLITKLLRHTDWFVCWCGFAACGSGEGLLIKLCLFNCTLSKVSSVLTNKATYIVVLLVVVFCHTYTRTCYSLSCCEKVTDVSSQNKELPHLIWNTYTSYFTSLFRRQTYVFWQAKVNLMYMLWKYLQQMNLCHTSFYKDLKFLNSEKYV
jgi:hypothetical protein